ncbi:MAG: TRAFs-binding domain-containing protein [Rhodospirillaceae bacterium]|nr:TRAFs-binding domain-containing protein [Rhodospirillaceae bacterium]
MGAIISPRDDSQSALDRARAFEKGGDLLAAYDVLAEALADAPHDIDLKHRAVLTLARAGATAHARREYLRLGLNDVTDHVDVLALGGRLLKDLALTATHETRRALARESADMYAKAYAVSGDYYPGINLATMTLLAGDPAGAADRARAVLRGIGEAAHRDYYAAATAAEAHLLQGHLTDADALFAQAIALDSKDFTAHASTLRQFGVICRALNIASGWLDRHRPPRALYYCGHMFALPGQYPPDLLSELGRGIDTALAGIRPGAIFGALAAGSDIMIAEAALRQGAELHVILPMREEDFIRQSVAPFGEAWIARFHACLRHAATYRLATHEPFLGDDSIFSYGTEIAMGLAVRHAETLETVAHLLAVWDSVPVSGPAGTGADVARWQGTARPATVIPLSAAMRAKPAPSVRTHSAPRPGNPARKLKAMLFGDVRGFSKLEESQIQPFVEHVLTPLSEELLGLPQQPDEVATWGDGLYVVYDDIAGATAGALALLRRFSEIDLTAAGLPNHLALRIGGHAGPVIPLTDPFMGTLNFFGTHVTLAARIEPVTMPGSFYVSEPFAAQLGLAAPGRYQTNYVGQTELAKKFGNVRLFAVNDAGGGYLP